MVILLSHLKRAEISQEYSRDGKESVRLRCAARSILNMMMAAMSADEVKDTNTKNQWEAAVAEKKANKEDASKEEKSAAIFDSLSDGWGWFSLKKQFGTQIEESFPELRIVVSVEDEDSKISIQNADSERLTKLFEVLGHLHPEAVQLANEVQRVVKNPEKVVEQSPGRSSEKISQQSADKEDNPDLRLLLLCPEITSLDLIGEDFDFDGNLGENENDGTLKWPPDNQDGRLAIGLSRFLTPLKGDKKVNPNLAPYEILMTVPGMSAALAREIVQTRQGSDGILGTEDDFVFKNVEDLKTLRYMSQFEQFEYNKMVPCIRFTSSCFTIRIFLESAKTGQVYRVQTCVKRGKKGRLQTLSWQEDAGY
jgi:hypothetical protein